MRKALRIIMKKTYIVTASIEIEVSGCEDEYEAIDQATDLIDLGNLEFQYELIKGDEV